MFKALLFDLGGVVISFDFQNAYAAIEAVCPHPAAEIPQRIRATGLLDKFECGLLDPEEFFHQFSAALDLRITFDQFRDIWSSIFLTHPLVPASLLARLRTRYRLIALSNTNALHFPLVRRSHPILDNFDAFVLSYEVKAMKPSPVIYQAAIATAGCRAEECFFTDDIPAYVEAARTQGIDAVQFISLQQLESDLKSRRILD
ncbi:MAG: HAD family phosphatase [Bryobacteraceae bacterium]